MEVSKPWNLLYDIGPCENLEYLFRSDAPIRGSNSFQAFHDPFAGSSIKLRTKDTGEITSPDSTRPFRSRNEDTKQVQKGFQSQKLCSIISISQIQAM